MDNGNAWNFCVTGNIVHTRIDDNGVLRYGTSGFSGGTKVYLQGKFWSEHLREQGLIPAIGLSRGKRYQCLLVPVKAIENVRFQRVFNPKVIDMMDDWEYAGGWWHRTAEDKREAKAFAEEWNYKINPITEKPYRAPEIIAIDEGDSPVRQEKFDFSLIEDGRTKNADDLKRRLSSMDLKGRIISDIKIFTPAYSVKENCIDEAKWWEMQGSLKELYKFVSEIHNADDSFIYPIRLDTYEPLLIRFTDGDQFEIFTEIVDHYYVGMNRISWYAEGTSIQDNKNGSVMLNVIKGATITDVEVVTGKHTCEDEYIDSVRIKCKKEDEYCVTIKSRYHVYMNVILEKSDGQSP